MRANKMHLHIRGNPKPTIEQQHDNKAKTLIPRKLATKVDLVYDKDYSQKLRHSKKYIPEVLQKSFENFLGD